jgi:peptide chain release factor 2
VRNGYQNYGAAFDIAEKEERVGELDKKMAGPDFWNDGDAAQTTLKERTRLLKSIDDWQRLSEELEEMRILFQLAEEEGDAQTVAEVDSRQKAFENKLGRFEFQCMLGAEEDAQNAIVDLNAGAGGTEAQDWAEMLLRMYLRWAERRGFKAEIVDILPGEEAGIKNVTFTVAGAYAYGFLKTEVGIHRLVRISPFDTGRRRHTSFASVFVYPEASEDIVIEIEEKDLRIDTYRSSGAGGQHVNKTDSAVRITHLPTGIVAQCQNERSQHKNRATAIKILRARLYERELQDKAQKMEEIHSSKKEIAWGSQIRSYILHPYRMVKDHRTQLVVGDADRVLDGDLDDLMEGYLLSLMSERKGERA